MLAPLQLVCHQYQCLSDCSVLSAARGGVPVVWAGPSTAGGRYGLLVVPPRGGSSAGVGLASSRVCRLSSRSRVFAREPCHYIPIRSASTPQIHKAHRLHSSAHRPLGLRAREVRREHRHGRGLVDIKDDSAGSKRFTVAASECCAGSAPWIRRMLDGLANGTCACSTERGSKSRIRRTSKARGLMFVFSFT